MIKIIAIIIYIIIAIAGITIFVLTPESQFRTSNIVWCYIHIYMLYTTLLAMALLLNQKGDDDLD